MRWGIIGGSGLDQWNGKPLIRHKVTTDYSKQPVIIDEFDLTSQRVFFLARHGSEHQLPPHRVNYRANIAALQQLQVTAIIAVTAVGAIAESIQPEHWVVPDQIIDYSWGREHSFSSVNKLIHIDFTWPFSEPLRKTLHQQLQLQNFNAHATATYACTQGPRLETSAEIRRLANDGCDIVGMTAMPEAALAREAEIPYANLSMVVNKAAGLGDTVVDIDEVIQRVNKMGQQAQGILLKLISSIEAETIYPL